MEGEEVTREHVAEAAERARQVLAAMDRGEVRASTVARAHVAGQVAALEALLRTGCT